MAVHKNMKTSAKLMMMVPSIVSAKKVGKAKTVPLQHAKISITVAITVTVLQVMMVYNKSASAMRAGQEKVVMKKWENAATILTVERMLSVLLNFYVNAKRAGKVMTVKPLSVLRLMVTKMVVTMANV